MADVLVTGASGFIGSHLTEALMGQGDRVRCLVRGTSTTEHLKALRATIVEGDVTDLDGLTAAIDGVDVVYHLAGMICALRSDDQLRINGLGSGLVAQACARQNRPPILVHVSSIAAAGPAPRHRLRSEEDRPAPVSNYGRSKRAGEIAVENWAGRVPTTIVRPGAVFGERDRLMLPMFVSVARFGVHAVAGMTSPKLSLIHVSDLVAMLMRAARCGARVTSPRANGHRLGHGYYFACAPEYPDYVQFGRLLARALECRWVLVLPIVQPLPWLVAGANQLISHARGRADPFNIDKIREATATSWACSSERARNQLDFTPAAPLIERLRQTSAWYRREGWL